MKNFNADLTLVLLAPITNIIISPLNTAIQHVRFQNLTIEISQKTNSYKLNKLELPTRNRWLTNQDNGREFYFFADPYSQLAFRSKEGNLLLEFVQIFKELSVDDIAAQNKFYVKNLFRF